jgi:hypothetical protein
MQNFRSRSHIDTFVQIKQCLASWILIQINIARMTKKKASVMIGLVIRIPTKFSLNFYDFSIIFYEFRKFELISEMNKRNKEIENNEA